MHQYTTVGLAGWSATALVSLFCCIPDLYRKETPRDVSAQFKEDSKGPITPVSQPVQPAALSKGKGKAVMKAVDGNEATANIAYAFNDVSFIYPITPATPMGEWVDQWSNEGRVNLHNNVMEVSSSAHSKAQHSPPCPAGAIAIVLALRCCLLPCMLAPADFQLCMLCFVWLHAGA